MESTFFKTTNFLVKKVLNMENLDKIKINNF